MHPVINGERCAYTFAYKKILIKIIQIIPFVATREILKGIAQHSVMVAK